jgi:hypothetical protein
VVEIKTPRRMDVAGELLLYYVMRQNVAFLHALVYRFPLLEMGVVIKASWDCHAELRSKEIPHEEVL